MTMIIVSQILYEDRIKLPTYLSYHLYLIPCICAHESFNNTLFDTHRTRPSEKPLVLANYRTTTIVYDMSI